MNIKAYADDTILYSGTSGTCTWQIDADGVLTLAPADGISGTLDVYESSLPPWLDYNTKITKLVIEEGVIAGTSLAFAFYDCTNLSAIEGIDNLDTSSITDISNMFTGCTSLKSLNLNAWDTSNLKKMYGAFVDCTSLKSINVSDWNTSNVTDIRYLFYNCTSLKSVDLTNWDVTNLERMAYTFQYCTSLTSLDLSTWDTPNLTRMRYCFNGCSALTYLNLANLNTTNASMDNAFRSCDALRTVVTGKNLRFSGENSQLTRPVDNEMGNGYWRSADGTVYENTEDIPDYVATTYTAVFSIRKAQLSKYSYQYDGSKHKPKVTVHNASGTVLSSDCYTVTYDDDCKSIGYHTVTITGTGVYTGTFTKTYKIMPHKPFLKSVTSSKKKTAKVVFKKVVGNAKYQVSYRVKGTKKWKTVTTKKTTVTLKKLKAGKTYQVRVRSFGKNKNGTLYSGWSKVKTVKVKK